MKLSAYYLKRPAVEAGPATIAGFERLYRQYVDPATGPRTGAEIPYDLDAPKWQFLCYLCDHKNVLMHGSAMRDITEFEPRQSNDIEEFGNRKAVYAASDGLWPMYFGIVDRTKVHGLVNACFRTITQDGIKSEPYYYFSIDRHALPLNPWREGMIYILPGDTFESQTLEDSGEFKIESSQWASLVGVTPLAKLAVAPEDFPFLKDVYGHDPEELFKKATANPKGFPWRDEPSSN